MKARKIPATMVTQHPDHANKPYWHYKTYVSTQYEAEEAYRSFAELGATEYKWDWEGKLVDESVVERFFGEYLSFFKKSPLGIKTFLTFRLPNPRVETEFRVGRAFMNMISAASNAKHVGFAVPPLFEVILPMTETPEEMLALQEAFAELRALKHPLYRMDNFLTNLRIIPLFESVATILRSDKIVEKYLSLYKKKFGKKPPYMRPYVARSDPALNSGLIPTVLAIKIALSRYKKLEKKLKLPLHPIIGAAALPFRGGLTPQNAHEFIQEYRGIRTTTIQSAFRYDFPLPQVISAIALLEKELPKGDPQVVSPSDEKKLRELIRVSETYYKEVIEELAPLINSIAVGVPRRRERFLHIGLYGYSRGEGKVSLPRAITFTGALYSFGLPPEIIGTGRTIAYAKKHNMLPLLEKYYLFLKRDVERAGKFVNKANIAHLAHKIPSGKKIVQDISSIEEYLGKPLEPSTSEEKRHHVLTGRMLSSMGDRKKLEQIIKQTAILRKSLG
ncbi:MAG TPA: phosphoenolpyruvate carboxylase [Candidatus Eisenbacteria bacterium]|nr:phosphoenolpyruvate carboxylase [Candidatus Eisenbacteria bacterium]